VKVASSLASGPHPLPELAATAVRQAFARAGLARADSVLLFLTRDFARHAQPALVAAARAAGSLQVSGCTAYGLLTEDGWLLDQSGAAALVVGETEMAGAPGAPLLSFSGHGTLPWGWQSGAPRAGLLDSDAAAWAHGRLVEDSCAEARLPGLRARIACSTGLRLLGEPLTVDAASGYDLQRCGGLPAGASLQRHLPPELRQNPPLHRLVVVLDAGVPGIPILGLNGDGSLNLAAALTPGTRMHWAIRQPLAAEQDMRQALSVAVNPEKVPDFAVMFSCLGRGPLFYGNDDRDLLAFREQFPGVPLIGAYGCGQIAPAAGENRLFQNTVVTLLYESAHV
jgi:small ligand-binding sensory domain FIST